MKLQESGEMYLETILILSNKSPHVRSLDVAEYMGFSKPSVSRAVGLLKKGGFITVSPEGFLQLTDEGMAVAVKIYERHVMIADFLERIGVDKETAVDDACKIEHDISETSFEALKKHFSALYG